MTDQEAYEYYKQRGVQALKEFMQGDYDKRAVLISATNTAYKAREGGV